MTQQAELSKKAGIGHKLIDSAGRVMRLAGYSHAGESVEKPSKYYHDNVVGTLKLLKS